MSVSVSKKVRTPNERRAQMVRVPDTEALVVVGLGYVGLPLALLAKHNHTFNVMGIDIDEKRRRAILEGSVPDLDGELADILNAHERSTMSVSDTFDAVKGADIIVVCVPTPVVADHGEGVHTPDLSAVITSMREIGTRLSPGALVILESTVNPGVSEEVVLPILEETSGLSAGVDFDYAHAPERINPGDQVWQPKRIPRVVGGITKKSTTRAARFYQSILDAEIKEMATIKEAEAVKMVENAFRDINIAFVNELAMSFTKLGIDIEHVLDGAATKPFGFMRHSPGCGVGGHCIPVDPYYLISYAASNGFTHRFLSVARDINNQMPHFAVHLLQDALAGAGLPLKGSRIALLGLAYKAGIGDTRESPAFEITAHLNEAGAIVQSFDPYVRELSTADSLEEALRGADAVLLATAHEEFKALTPEDIAAHRIRLVVDGRNCLPKEAFVSAGIGYVGIGR